jgi:hypothetical protein
MTETAAPAPTTADVATAITAFVAALKAKSDARMTAQFPELALYVFGVDQGRKYARVWNAYGDGRGRSVVAFVDLATGDIYKPEGWKRPAKHIRGNVLSSQGGMECIEPSGHVCYLT